MRRSPSAAAALFLTLAGCGGVEPGLSIRFESSTLLAQADQVVVYFYGASLSCDVIRQTVPRPPSVLGPFAAPVDAEGKQRGIVFPLDPIPVNEYVVFVDALDINGGNVGSGCAPGQMILEKEVSAIMVTITDDST